MKKLLSETIYITGKPVENTIHTIDESNRIRHIHFVKVSFDDIPNSCDQLVITRESDIRAERNKRLYSGDLKGKDNLCLEAANQNEFKEVDDLDLHAESKNPVDLQPNEVIRISYTNTNQLTGSIYFWDRTIGVKDGRTYVIENINPRLGSKRGISTS